MPTSPNDDHTLRDDDIRRLVRQCAAERTILADRASDSSVDDEIQELLEECAEGRANTETRARLTQLVGDSSLAELMLEACAAASESPTPEANVATGFSPAREFLLPPLDLRSNVSAGSRAESEDWEDDDWEDDDWGDDDDVDHAAVWADVKAKLQSLKAVRQADSPRDENRRRKSRWWTTGVVAGLATALVVAVFAIPYWYDRGSDGSTVAWNDPQVLAPATAERTRGSQDAKTPGSEWTFSPPGGESTRHRWIVQIEDTAYLIDSLEKGQSAERVRVDVGSYLGGSLYLLVISADEPTQLLTRGPIAQPKTLSSLLTAQEIRELQRDLHAADESSHARIKAILHGALRREFQDSPYSLQIYVFPYNGT